MSETRHQAERAKQAYFKLQTMDRTAILRDLAKALRASADVVFAANKRDLEAAKETLSKPLYKRLVLDEPKLRDVIDGMVLRSRAFEIEPELTAKILKRGYTIFEVPISYNGRAFHEGKKISWKDGFSAVRTLVRYRFMD